MTRSNTKFLYLKSMQKNMSNMITGIQPVNYFQRLPLIWKPHVCVEMIGYVGIEGFFNIPPQAP